LSPKTGAVSFLTDIRVAKPSQLRLDLLIKLADV
jgi:hypothetical protein